jgi:hypothetical protein
MSSFTISKDLALVLGHLFNAVTALGEPGKYPEMRVQDVTEDVGAWDPLFISGPHQGPEIDIIIPERSTGSCDVFVSIDWKTVDWKGGKMTLLLAGITDEKTNPCWIFWIEDLSWDAVRSIIMNNTDIG